VIGMRCSRCLAALMLVLLVWVVGCAPQEGIRSYTTSTKQEMNLSRVSTDKSEVADANPTGADRSRTLGLIIPLGGNYSRFIKFRNSVEVVTKFEAGFKALVQSIQSVGTEADLPQLKLPEGWTENPPRQFVAKSFKPAAGANAEVTVSMPIGGNLLDNVNRWRKEVGAAEVTADQLMQTLQEIRVGVQVMYLVDVRGPADPSANSMRGPFMGGKQ